MLEGLGAATVTPAGFGVCAGNSDGLSRTGKRVAVTHRERNVASCTVGRALSTIATQHATDKIALRDSSPIATVQRVAAVITHDEVASSGHSQPRKA